MIVLTLNAGSNSLKFEIVAAEADSGFGASLIAGAYDDIGKEHSVFSLLENKRPYQSEELEIHDHGHATKLLLNGSSGEALRVRVSGTWAISIALPIGSCMVATALAGPRRLRNK